MEWEEEKRGLQEQTCVTCVTADVGDVRTVSAVGGGKAGEGAGGGAAGMDPEKRVEVERGDGSKDAGESELRKARQKVFDEVRMPKEP